MPKDIFQQGKIRDDRAWNLTFGEYHRETIFNPDGSMQMDPGYRLQNNPLMSPAHLQVNPTPMSCGA
ncbi:MAG: hypothetical protein ACOX5R_22255 [bacterium]